MAGQEAFRAVTIRGPQNGTKATPQGCPGVTTSTHLDGNPEYSEKANQPWPLPSVLGNGDGGRTGSNTWNGHRVPTTVPGVLPTSSMFQSHGNRNDDESNGDFTGSGVDSQGLDILTWLLWKLWAQQVREERTLCLKYPHYRLHLFWG